MIRFNWFSRLRSFVIAASVALMGAGPVWAQRGAPETDYLLSPLPERAWCEGQVVDARQQPVPGARLFLVPQLHRHVEDYAPPSESTAVTHAAETDSQGRFEFDLPIDRDPEFWRSQDLALIVQAEGFETLVLEVKTPRLLANAPFQLKMKAGKPTRLLVRHADESPVPHAKVRLSRIGMLTIFESANGLPVFQSGSQGEVHLSGWSAENLQEIAVQLADGAEVRVEVKPTGGDLLATLPPLARVAGRAAIEIQGQPQPVDRLVGKRWWIVSTGTNRASVGVPKSWTPVTVQQDGSFLADGVIAGHLRAWFPTSPQFPYLPAGDLGRKSYELLPGLDVDDIAATLVPAQSITVQFRDDHGARIGGVRATLLSQFYQIAISDAEGKASFWVPRGDAVNVTGQFYDPLERFESGNFEIAVMEREQESPRVVELVRSAAVVGQVVDSSGRPVVGAKVIARYTEERETVERAAWSDVTGAFILRGLPKHATVELTARKDGLTTSTDQPIRATAGQTEPIDLVVQEVPTARLTGRVTDEAGRPLAGARVMISRVKTVQEEGFRAEMAFPEPLDDLPVAVTDSTGRFETEPITVSNDRFILDISAPGFRPWRTHFLHGERRRQDDGTVDLGTWRLFEEPRRQTCEIVARLDDGAPVEGARIVLLGPRTGKLIAQTDADGRARIDGRDGPQIVAVYAPGHALHVDYVANLPAEMNIEMRRQSLDDALAPVENWGMQEDELRQVALQLLAPLAVPEPGKHSPYYQWRYYGALLTANPERFVEEIVESGSNSPYRDMFLQVFQQDLLQEFGVEAIDWSAPADGNLMARAYTLAQYSLLLDPADEELREELLGEAMLAWQSIDGAEQRSAARMLLPALALQGRLDVAKRLAQEMWDDCPEYEELLEKGEAKADVAFSRTLAPFLGWVEPELPFRLLPLVAGGPEVDHWQSVAAVWLSLSDRDEADRLTKQYGVDWEDGVEELCISNFSWLCRDRSLTDWLEWLANQTEPSPSKLRLQIAIARHQQAGPERLRSFEQICDTWRKIKVSDAHYMQAPNTRVLESLAGFDDLRIGEIEQLVFTALETSPVTYDSYHSLADLANALRLLAVASPEASLQLTKNVLDDWHWMYFGKRLFTDSNPVVGAVVWAAPYAALEVVHDLEQRMADDMSVSRLQFRTALIEEIKALLSARARSDD